MIHSRRAIFRQAGAALLAGTGGAALAACQVGGTDTSTTSTQETSGRIEIWGFNSVPFTDGAPADILREFQAKHPRVQLEYLQNNDTTNEKLRVQVAGGTSPDLASAGSSGFQHLALDGIARSLEPFIKKSKVVAKADMWPDLVREHTWKGELRGITYGPDIRLLYVHSNLYQRAGLDATKPPKTWDELEANVAKTMARDGQKLSVEGFDPFLGSGELNLWPIPFWQLGGELLSADGTKVTIANDHGLKAWTFLKSVIDRQGGWTALQEFKTGKAGNQLFADGVVSHYYATNSERARLQRDLAPGIQFGFATYPMPAGGRRISFGGVNGFLMTTGSPNPDAAWAFLEHLWTPENVVKLCDYHDRVPPRQSVAASEQYVRNDPFRKLVGEEMKGRRWLIALPGAAAMRTDLQNVANDILRSNMGIMEALTKAQTAMQAKLEEALRAAK